MAARHNNATIDAPHQNHRRAAFQVTRDRRYISSETSQEEINGYQGKPRRSSTTDCAMIRALAFMSGLFLAAPLACSAPAIEQASIPVSQLGREYARGDTCAERIETMTTRDFTPAVHASILRQAMSTSRAPGEIR